MDFLFVDFDSENSLSDFLLVDCRGSIVLCRLTMAFIGSRIRAG
jgi:hypothetical protein